MKQKTSTFDEHITNAAVIIVFKNFLHFAKLQ